MFPKLVVHVMLSLNNIRLFTGHGNGINQPFGALNEGFIMRGRAPLFAFTENTGTQLRELIGSRKNKRDTIPYRLATFLTLCDTLCKYSINSGLYLGLWLPAPGLGAPSFTFTFCRSVLATALRTDQVEPAAKRRSTCPIMLGCIWYVQDFLRAKSKQSIALLTTFECAES